MINSCGLFGLRLFGRRGSMLGSRHGTRREQRGTVWLEALVLVVLVLAVSLPLRGFVGTLAQGFTCAGERIRNLSASGGLRPQACGRGQAAARAAIGAHSAEFENRGGAGEASRSHFAMASVPIELPPARAGHDALQGGAGKDTLAAIEGPSIDFKSEKPTERFSLVPSPKEIYISKLVVPLEGVGADDVRAVTDSISRLDLGAIRQTPRIVIVPPSAPPIPRQPSGLWVRVLEGRVTGSDGNPLLREVGMSIESSLRERGHTGVLDAQRAAAARDRAAAPAIVTRERIAEITSFAESFELYYTQPTVFRALAPKLFEFWSSDPLLQVPMPPVP